MSRRDISDMPHVMQIWWRKLKGRCLADEAVE
jgi:hypothetical protein